MADNNDANGRVTMAVLGTKMDQLAVKLEEACRDMKDSRREREEGFRQSRLVDEALATRVTKLEERTSIVTWLQAGLSALLSALAAWLGMRT